jgi:hypothetical protein
MMQERLARIEGIMHPAEALYLARQKVIEIGGVLSDYPTPRQRSGILENGYSDLGTDDYLGEYHDDNINA